MADDLFTMDPHEQMRLLSERKNKELLLVPMLETVCNTLVMGFEDYLRAFDPNAGFTTLCDVGLHCTGINGDARTMCLRALALVLEHVPNSTQVGIGHAQLLQLTSESLKNCRTYSYECTACSGLAEEGLRIIHFLSREDTGGALVAAGVLGQVLTVMEWSDPRTAAQSLDTLANLCRKLILSSSGAKNNYVPPPKKAAKKGGGEASAFIPSGSQITTIAEELRKKIVPALSNLLKGCAVTSAVNDQWNMVEGVCTCLTVIARRSQHQGVPDIVEATLAPETIQSIFEILRSPMAATEAKKEFLLHILIELAQLPRGQRAVLRELLDPKVTEFFKSVLKTTDKNVTAFLEDPFSKKVAESRNANVFTTMLLMLISSVCHPIPPSIRHFSFMLLPVHDWEWEDDLHSFSKYPEEVCVQLEQAYAKMENHVQIKIRGNNYDVDLWAMRQHKERGRAIRRKAGPRTVVQVEDATASSQGGGPGPCSVFRQSVSKKEENESIAFLKSYLPLLLTYGCDSIHDLQKLAVALSVSQVIYQCLPTVSDDFVNHVSLFASPICLFLSEMLISESEQVIDLAMISMDLLLHHRGQEWLFAELSARFGLRSTLTEIIQTGGKNMERAAFLAEVCNSMRHDQNKSPVASHTPLAATVELFKNSSAKFQAVYLKEVLQAVSQSSSVTPFEFAQIGVAEAIMSYLKRGVDEAEREKRKQALIEVLSADTQSMAVLIRQLVSTLNFQRSLPEIEAMTTTRAVKARPLAETLQLIASISPTIDICTNRKGGTDEKEPPPPQPSVVAIMPDRRTLCPAGHKLTTYNSTSWSCDICGRGSNGENSMACRKCDFDICTDCYMNDEVEYEGGDPQPCAIEASRPALPGYPAHFFSTIGDVEKFFRYGAHPHGAGMPGFGEDDHGSMRELMEMEMLLEHLHRRASDDLGEEEDGDERAERMKMMHALLRDRMVRDRERRKEEKQPGKQSGKEKGKSGGKPNPKQGASPQPKSHEFDQEKRLELYYEGVGLCDLHEPLLSVLYRKAFTRRIPQALEVFEASMLIPAEHAQAKKPPPVSTSVPPQPKVSAKDPIALKEAKKKEKLEKKIERGKKALTTGGSASSSSATTTTTTAGKVPVEPPSVANPAQSMPKTPNTPAAMRSAKEFAESSPTKQRTLYFHVFLNEGDQQCACQEMSRIEAQRARLESVPRVPISDLQSQPELQLLCVLWEISHMYAGGNMSPGGASSAANYLVPNETFYSQELSAKVVKACVTSAIRVAVLPPSYALPAWVTFLMTYCRFLFPSEIRMKVAIFLTSGARRAFFSQLQNEGQILNQSSKFDIFGSEWSPRQTLRPAMKIEVKREQVLRDAQKFVLDRTEYRKPLTIEFTGDKGTGLGPTVQFFTKIAVELSAKKLNLWRSIPSLSDAEKEDRIQTSTEQQLQKKKEAEDPEVEVLNSPAEGFYPLVQPTPPSKARSTSSSSSMDSAAINKLYQLAGTMCARALSDGRVFGLPISPALLNMLRAPMKCTGFTIQHVSLMDTGVASSLRHLNKILEKVAKVERAYGIKYQTGGVGGERANIVRTSPTRNVNLIMMNGEPLQSPSQHLPSDGDTMTATCAKKLELGEVSEDEDQINVQKVVPQHQQQQSTGGDTMDLLEEEAEEGNEMMEATEGFPSKTFTATSNLSPSPATSTGGPTPTIPQVAPLTEQEDKDLAKLEVEIDTELEALDLIFVLPGYDEVELVPGGKSITVKRSNLRQFLQLVCDYLLYTSVASAVDEFRRGFLNALPCDALGLLSPTELSDLICGIENTKNPLWTVEEMLKCIKADHGYRGESPQVSNLIEVISLDFTPKQQSLFLEFCTGCPRLPVGGLGALGNITVVRKDVRIIENAATSPGSSAVNRPTSAGSPQSVSVSGSPGSGVNFSTPSTSFASDPNASSITIDMGLPSVNTCFKYLKLPPYPTKEMLKEKLLVAIQCAGDGFDLS